MTRFFKKIIIRTIKKMNWLGSGLSIRLVKWTGKSSQYIHPKHLINNESEWLRYFENQDEVLDIGCANGQRDFKLAPHVKNITAFDYDEKLLKQAESWRISNGIKNIKFTRLSAEEPLPFKDETFNKILFLDVIEHLVNRNLILKECRRVLKKKGLLVLAAPNKNTCWKNFQKSAGENYFADPDHKIEYSKKEIMREHEIADLKILEIHPVVYDTPFSGLIDFIGGINLSLYKKLSLWKRKKASRDPENSNGFLIVSQKNV